MPPFLFQREAGLRQLQEAKRWDVVVIGGGATGLGIAIDAANRGLKTLLLEAADFAKGTSSRSTKLVHGGVRYLAQGNIALVLEALRERGYLLRNAAHLVKKQAFIIPCYSYGALVKYWVGLKMYDWLSGRLSFGSSTYLSAEAVTTALPTIKKDGLKGGVQYFDGQFDDARLALNLAQTAVREGATVLNYMQVKGLVKTGGKITGLNARDVEANKEYVIEAAVVVNATGVFVDEVLRLDDPVRKQLVRPSQGIHLVLPASFLKSSTALMIPKTSDGRVLFLLPWHGHLLAGTTDTPLQQHATEPQALEAEIDFVLQNVTAYLTKPPRKADVLSMFAGLRPLALSQNDATATKELSRSHKLFVSPSGLVTIIGGKWTTYRQMAEDVVNSVIKQGGFKKIKCATRRLPVHGCATKPAAGHWWVYGSDAAAVQAVLLENKENAKPLAAGYPYTEAEVAWAVHYEMACTVEDVLARRLRLLFLNAGAALAAAPHVAQLVAQLRGKDESWEQNQLQQFHQLAAQYLPKEAPLYFEETAPVGKP